MLLAPLLAGVILAQGGPGTAPADRAFALVGTWSCNAANQAPSLLVFKPYAGGLLMRYAYQDSTPGEIDADLRYDRPSRTWTLDQQATTFRRFRGTAGPWTGQLWQFEGAVFPADPDSMFDQIETARVTFVAFGNDAFEMIRSQRVGGQWVSHDPWYSAVVDIDCTRSSRPGGS